MRIAMISDLHGYLPEPGFIPESDLLLIAGDVCPVWDHQRQYQARWLRTKFSEWLREQPAKAIVGVGGNHDFVLQDNSSLGFELPWSYLNNGAITVALPGQPSVKVWGSPLSPTFGNWAFMREDRALAEVWENIPPDVDIILVHGPAFGYGDRVKNNWNPDPHVGSKTLANRLWYGEFDKLKLIVSGHIHEGYGAGQVKRLNGSLVTWVNASYVDEKYNTSNPVQVFEL